MTSLTSTAVEYVADADPRHNRARCFRTGALIDVSEIAHVAGFRFPVAVTRAVWGNLIEPTPEARAAGEAEALRVLEVLQSLSNAIPRAPRMPTIYFCCYLRDSRITAQVTLKSHIGPDDDGQPAVTVMLPDEL
jgi:hypothetical protein